LPGAVGESVEVLNRVVPPPVQKFEKKERTRMGEGGIEYRKKDNDAPKVSIDFVNQLL